MRFPFDGLKFNKSIMYFKLQQQQRKIRKTTITWKLNLTSGWAMTVRAYIQGGLYPEYLFCLQVDGPITGRGGGGGYK